MITTHLSFSEANCSQTHTHTCPSSAVGIPIAVEPGSVQPPTHPTQPHCHACCHVLCRAVPSYPLGHIRPAPSTAVVHAGPNSALRSNQPGQHVLPDDRRAAHTAAAAHGRTGRLCGCAGSRGVVQVCCAVLCAATMSCDCSCCVCVCCTKQLCSSVVLGMHHQPALHRTGNYGVTTNLACTGDYRVGDLHADSPAGLVMCVLFAAAAGCVATPTSSRGPTHCCLQCPCCCPSLAPTQTLSLGRSRCCFSR